MPKKNLSITKVSVTSRRSIKILNDYFTFECMLESDTSKVKDIDEHLDLLWEKAHTEVDTQCKESVQSIMQTDKGI